jgi:hypothetical protein
MLPLVLCADKGQQGEFDRKITCNTVRCRNLSAPMSRMARELPIFTVKSKSPDCHGWRSKGEQYDEDFELFESNNIVVQIREQGEQQSPGNAGDGIRGGYLCGVGARSRRAPTGND